MSPSSREREYARRRYEKWQARQTTKARRLRQARRRALIVVAAAAGVLAVVAAVVVYGPERSPATPVAAVASATPSGTAAAGNPCPTPPDTQPNATTYPSAPPASLAEKKSWNLTMDTSCGPIVIELDGAAAPRAVASMIFLAGKGFFDNTRCHRLTTAESVSVVQCGDPTGTGGGGPGYSYGPVENAPADNVYPAGTVAMARQPGKADSMGSQFFLVYKDSTIPSDAAGGYTVIGTIVSGLATVEKVAAGGVLGGGTDGAPARAVTITGTTVG